MEHLKVVVVCMLQPSCFNCSFTYYTNVNFTPVSE